MARSLNFREFAQPKLHLTMNDAEGTELNVIAPTVELVERLEANYDILVGTLRRADRESISETWKLAADLISCNLEGIHVTVEDLKGRYRMSYEMLMAFLLEHIAFTKEIEAAKN